MGIICSSDDYLISWFWASYGATACLSFSETSSPGLGSCNQWARSLRFIYFCMGSIYGHSKESVHQRKGSKKHSVEKFLENSTAKDWIA